MRRAFGYRLALILCSWAVACGGVDAPGETVAGTPEATATVEQASPSPLPPPPDCAQAEERTTEVVAAALVATQAEGKGFTRTLRELGNALEDLIFFVGDVESYLEDYGPYEGGDECLSLIASAEAVAVEAVGIGEEQAARAYQLLLRYYPDSLDALDAENFLTKYGWPIPDPAPSDSP